MNDHSSPNIESRSPAQVGAITLVGLGNIGSHLVQLLANLPGLTQVTLVDKDRYEPANLATQRITRADVGGAKSAVQAAWLRLHNPSVQVTAVAADIAHVPAGYLRCSGLIIACLDSLASRVVVNQLAWRLGIPFLDAGVNPEAGLVRINAYQPIEEAACFECPLCDEDYRSMGGRTPCEASDRENPPTNAPAALGAMAAALLGVECGKFFRGDVDAILFGRQFIVNVAQHTSYRTSFRRNPKCRFHHALWDIRSAPVLSPEITLGAALDLIQRHAGDHPRLGIEGRFFASAWHCPKCGSVGRGGNFRLDGRIPNVAARCTVCRNSNALLVSGPNLVPWIHRDLPELVLGLSLADVGIVSGDIVTVMGEGQSFQVEVLTQRVHRCDAKSISEPTLSPGGLSAAAGVVIPISSADPTIEKEHR